MTIWQFASPFYLLLGILHVYVLDLPRLEEAPEVDLVVVCGRGLPAPRQSLDVGRAAVVDVARVANVRVALHLRDVHLSNKGKQRLKAKRQMRHLESPLLCEAPHLLVVLALVVDAVDHEEGEESVLDLLLERLEQRGAVRDAQLLVVLVLEKM